MELNIGGSRSQKKQMVCMYFRRVNSAAWFREAMFLKIKGRQYGQSQRYLGDPRVNINLSHVRRQTGVQRGSHQEGDLSQEERGRGKGEGTQGRCLMKSERKRVGRFKDEKFGLSSGRETMVVVAAGSRGKLKLQTAEVTQPAQLL